MGNGPSSDFIGEEDITALQKLCDDDASGVLTEYFRESDGPEKVGEDGRVTELDLADCSIAELPDAIGGLGALKKLDLNGCESLAELPAAIGELGALEELILSGCSKLVALPAAIGKLGALTILDLDGCSSLTYPPEETRGDVHKTVGFCCLDLLEGNEVSAADVEKSIVVHVITGGDLMRINTLASKDSAFAGITKLARADFAALQKLCDDDASGALTEYFGDGEDPREWKGVTVNEGRVTTLSLHGCSSLVELPDAIGGLGALTELNLFGCSSLAKLPDAVVGREGLTVTHPKHLDPLEKDFVALRKLRDESECDELKQAWSAEDPTEWKCEIEGSIQPCVMAKDGRVFALVLSFPSLAVLPDTICELGALTTLNLGGCSSLAALPAAIGELKALTRLDLYGCSNLEKVPDAIDGSEKLTVVLPLQLNGPLQEDFVALRSLRDDDTSDGALKEYLFGDDEDPSLWRRGTAIKRVGGRVNELDLSNCWDLAKLSDAIGGLGALTRLNLRDCKSLSALPAAIGELGALKELDLSLCSEITALPATIGKLGSLTTLKLYDCSSLAALPDAIGELGALTELNLQSCTSLTELPAAIGGLTGLTMLNLCECSSLAALPAAIGELGVLTELGLQECSSLVELPAAIGELKALTKLYLAKCSNLAALPDAIGKLGALKGLDLEGCSSLTALPDAIGGLKALTRLNLYNCSSLVALPESISGLDALQELIFAGCSKLIFPPKHVQDPLGVFKDKSLETLKRFLLNTTDLLDCKNKDHVMTASSTIDADVMTGFFDGVIAAPSYAERLEGAVRQTPALADLTNDKGQRAIDLACLDCRRAMQKALYFLGRYEIDDGPPEHRSATSLVVRAVDAAAADDYGKLFDEADNGDGTLDSDELKALAAKLGTDVEILKLEDGESYTKEAFVAKCQQLFGKERKVVIKIFQVEEQWANEKKARDDLGLDAQFVVQTIPAPRDEEFAKALDETHLLGEGVGSRAIVMDAADRNLFQIYQSERPDLNTVRVLMRQVMECVQHLHKKGLVHGDIKMLNVVRLSLDNRLRLIDLDAAAKISAFGGEASYVGSKFSSAVLPPECFAKLGGDQVGQFETYFEGADAELREKVAPKTKQGASYVVRTFSLNEDGAPKDGLPYELVEASVAVDYWSLGALLFQLIAGEPLVPSNRDDDCVDGNAMAALDSWNDDAGKKRLAVIKDAAAWDLASKLLVRDPDERAKFSITDTLAKHPFFNPESGDAETKQALKEIRDQQKEDSKKLDAIDERTAAILKLSEENKFELQRTRQVLLKAVFEATEVTTPTTFVVLEKPLPPPFTPEEKTWIENNVVFKDDGSGVEIKGKAPEWFADVEARLQDSMTLAEQGMDMAKNLAKFKPDDVLTPRNLKSVIKRGIKHFFPTTTLYFYLVDELTGKPVRGGVYPILIEEPAEKLAKLLPVMQVGLHAMSAYNGVAGLAQMFGYPVPKVPERWRKAAQGSVDLLKQDSSVAAFGVVHDKSKSKDKESSETVRGASLRELKEFFKEKDPKESYAGLRRIGDPNDGTAIWTKVKDEDLEATLKARAAERRAEEELRREDILASERPPGAQSVEAADRDKPASSPTSPKSVDDGGITEGATVSREEIDKKLKELEERLINKLETANTGCKCVIA